MGIIKDALAGAICMSVGYYIGVTRHEYVQHPSFLEQQATREEQRADNLDALATFLQTYTPSQRHQNAQQNESLSINEIWNSFPPALKKKILDASKDALEQQVKHSYQSLKDQSSSMYDEMKHFLNKKLNGEGK